MDGAAATGDCGHLVIARPRHLRRPQGHCSLVNGAWPENTAAGCWLSLPGTAWVPESPSPSPSPIALSHLVRPSLTQSCSPSVRRGSIHLAFPFPPPVSPAVVHFPLHALTVPPQYPEAPMRPRPFWINCVAGLWGNDVEEITYPTKVMNAQQRVPWMEKLQGVLKLANNRAGIDWK